MKFKSNEADILFYKSRNNKKPDIHERNNLSQL